MYTIKQVKHAQIMNNLRPYSSLRIHAALAAGLCLVALISSSVYCHCRIFESSHLDLLDSTGHASCFTSGVFWAFVGDQCIQT